MLIFVLLPGELSGGGYCPGVIVWGELSGGYCPGAIVPGGIVSGGIVRDSSVSSQFLIMYGQTDRQADIRSHCISNSPPFALLAGKR
jgi:hypothetical protein